MRFHTVGCVMTLALSLLTAPLALNAQPPATMSRIGVLHGGALTPERAHRQQAFQQGLHDLGWVEGHNIVIEYRYAEGKVERLPDLAAELISLNMQVLVVDGTAGAEAAKHVTQTVPIVMLWGTDPVEGGLVASLARPGGNLTGFSLAAPELSGKRLELFRELVPTLQ